MKSKKNGLLVSFGLLFIACIFLSNSLQAIALIGNLFVEIEQENISTLNGNDGTISLVVSGGYPPYSYQWNTGDTISVLNDLAPGQYAVTVSDSQGEQKITSTYICDYFTYEIELISGNCEEGDTALAVITFEGLNGEKDYCFNHGNPYIYYCTNTIENSVLALAGIGNFIGFDVYLEDEYGCNAFINIPVGTFDTIPPTVVATPLVASLDSLGNIMVDPELVDAGSTDDCTAVRHFELSQVSFDCNHLGINEVQFFVGDLAGNFDSVFTTIEIIDTIAPIITCPENIISSTCDTLYYEFQELWDNCTVDSLILLEGLESGVVFPEGITQISYQAKDHSGNSKTCSFSVEIIHDLSAEHMVEDVSCFGEADGNISIEIMGGTAPYEVIGEVENLPQGQYSIEIMDANACVVRDTFLINQPEAFEIDIIDSTPTSCFDSYDGSITYRLFGGTNTFLDTIITVSDLPKGSNSLTAYDLNDCLAEEHIIIDGPEEINILLNDLYPAFGGDYFALGFIDITIEGGVGDYTFEWFYNGVFYNNEEDIDSLYAGDYHVVVTDGNGCVKSFDVTVDLINATNQINGLENLSIFPNPTTDQLFINFNYLGKDQLQIQLLDARGRVLQSQSAFANNTMRVVEYPSGLYFLRITNGRASAVEKVIIE